MKKSTAPEHDPMEYEEMRIRLEEAEETLNAIRNGEVDALVVTGEQGEQIFTLKDASQPYQVMVDSMNEGAFTISRSGRILYCNKRFTEIAGLSMELILGESFRNLVSQEDRRTADRLIRKSLKQASKGELLLGWSDPKAAIEISLSPFSLDGVTCLIALVTDITERKQTEAELDRHRLHLQELVEEQTVQLENEIEERKQIEADLRFSEENAKKHAAEVEAIIQSLPGEVTIYDRDGRVVRSNKLADDFLGYSGVEANDDAPDLQVLNASQDPVEVKDRPVQRALAGEMVKGEVLCIQRGQDPPKWISSSAAPIYKDGTLTGVVEVVSDITPIKAMEEELRRSEKKYRELVKYAPVGIYQVDFRTRKFVSINDVVIQQTGYSREELFNMTPFDILDAPSQALFGERIRKWLAGEKPEENVEYRVIAKDGHEIFAVLNVNFTRDENGLPQGATVVGYDITERKKSEEALAHSENLLRTVINTIPEPLYLKDHEGRLILANKATLAVIGKPEEDVLGKTDAEYYDDPATGRAIMENDRRIMNTGQMETVEESVVDPDGIRYFLSIKAPYYDAKGQISGIVGTASDITERKRDEETRNRLLAQLEEQTAELNAIIEAVPVGLAIADDTGKLNRFNGAAKRILKLQTSDLSNSIPDRLRQMGITRADGRPFRREETPFYLANQGQVATDQLLMIHRDGEVQYLNANAAPIRKGDGTILGAITSFEDISWRMQAEEATLQARLEAERRAGELEAIMQAVPVGIMITRDPEGRFITGNRATHEVLRVPLTEPNISKSAPDPEGKLSYTPVRNGAALPPEELPIQMAVRGQQVRDWECDLVFSNKDMSHVIINATPLYDENGQPRGAVAALVDMTERKRAEEALRTSESRYRTLVEQSPDAIFINRGEKIVLINQAALDLFGAGSASQVLGKAPYDFFHPSQHDLITDRIKTLFAGGAIPTIEVKVMRLDGSLRTAEVTAELISDAEGPAAQVILHDVTERKERETELKRLNRTLQALSNINQSMVHATDEREYMNEVCRIVVDDCGHMMSWIGLAEQDEAKTVRPVASAGFEEGYLDTLKLTWADTERGRGPSGTAVRTGQVTACPNMLSDPRFAPWRIEALKRGYAASIALPLISEGKVFGVFTIYSHEPDPFSKSEMDLLNELASDLAYGIVMIRTKAAQAQAEIAVRESEARFRTLADGSFEGLVIHENGILLDVNARITDMLGYTAEELIGKAFWDYIDEGYHDRVKQALRSSFTGLYEVELIHKDGRRVPIEVVGRQLEWKGRTVRVTALRDISERRKAEAALRESEARYRSLFNSMTEGFALHEIICDEQGQPVDYRFLDVNPAFESLTGLKRDNLIGRTYNEALPGNGPVWVQRYGNVALTGQPISFEDYAPELNRYYDVRAYSPAEGQFAVIFMDVTQRKELEESIRVSLTKYTTLFNSFPLGITVSDGEGKIIETNQEAARLLGISEEKQLGRNISGREWKIIRTDGTPFPAEEFASVRALKEGRRIENVEMGIVKNDRQVTWISVTAAPLPVEGYGVVVTYGDVTDRKRLENDLRDAREQAERHANELETVFNAIPDGIVVYDTQGQAQQANRVAVDMLGFDPTKKMMGELANMLSTRTMDGQLLKLADAPTTRALSGKTVSGNRYIIHNGQKVDTIVSTSSSPLWMGEKIAGAVTVMQDVTEKYKAEETQAWLASFPELNPNPIVEIDPSGTIRYMNPAIRKLIPDLEERGLEHPWLNGLLTLAAEILQSNSPIAFREVQVGEDYFWQSVSIVPQNGRIRTYAFEITKRKEALKALERSNQRLELMTETVSRLLVSPEPQKVVEELCQKVLAHLDCQVFINYLVDEEAGRLHLNASGGITPHHRRRLEWLDFGVAVCGKVAETGERIIAENIPVVRDPRTDLVRGMGIQAYACHPLKVQGKVIGTLSFGTRTRTHYSEDDLALMKAVTDHVAIAMGRYRAEQAVIRARDELEQRVQERTQELRAVNDRLGMERQRFNDVLDDLPAYLILLTADYHVSFANRYFEERFGKSEGRRCYEYLFHRTEPCEICETYRTLKENRPLRWEWTGPDQRIYDIHDFPFTDVDGTNLILEMGIDITERKKAEAEVDTYRQHLEELVEERTNELQKERTNLQKIFDVVNVGMLLVNESGTVKRINNVVRQWTGEEEGEFGLEDLQSGDALGCLHAIQSEAGCGTSQYCANCRIRNTFESVLQTGQARHDVEVFSTLVMEGDRKSMWLDISADPLEVDGRPHVILALNDITDRKTAEYALRQARDELEERVKERTQELSLTNDHLLSEVAERKRAEEELRLQTSAMEAAANGIIITDRNGMIEWCNPAFTQMTGYSYVEIMGQNPRLLKSGKQSQRFYEEMWQTLLSGRVWRGEMINKRKDGVLYTEEEIITPVHDDHGEISHFIAVKQDITSRKEAEEALRLANAYNRSLLEASIDPIATITPNGKIGDVNSATEKVTGRKRQELIGTDFHSYFSDPDKARQAYQKVFETGSVHDYELEMRHKGGHITPVLYNGSVYRDENDKVQGVFAVARDITDRRQFEAQLMQAEKHAVIGRMVGSVTHEINNPLQTIKNCLYLIQQDTPADSPIVEPLDMASSETARLTDIVGQLRELYRPRTDVQDHPHEILDILEEIHALLTPHLNNSHVRWNPLTGMRRCYINCIRDQILEVFLNISMNAIEAMKSDGGVLSLDMAFKDELVGVVFRDTGPGVSEEILPHIFEPFTTTKNSGLGLGLSISYGIVQRHGGQITVENCPEGGALFTVWLPVARKDKKENTKHAPKR